MSGPATFRSSEFHQPMAAFGDLRPGSGKAAGRHDWTDPAGCRTLPSEPNWPKSDIEPAIAWSLAPKNAIPFRTETQWRVRCRSVSFVCRSATFAGVPHFSPAKDESGLQIVANCQKQSRCFGQIIARDRVEGLRCNTLGRSRKLFCALDRQTGRNNPPDTSVASIAHT